MMSVKSQIREIAEHLQWSEEELYQWRDVEDYIREIIDEYNADTPEIFATEFSHTIGVCWKEGVYGWKIILYMKSCLHIEAYAIPADPFYLPEVVISSVRYGTRNELTEFLDYYLRTAL
jgi:hypothetical protein